MIPNDGLVGAVIAHGRLVGPMIPDHDAGTRRRCTVCAPGARLSSREGNILPGDGAQPPPGPLVKRAMKKALAQVKRNKGASGLDGMTVNELAPYLNEHWPTIRAQLLEGPYKPQPVRRVEIPKASGGTRPLGIPTTAPRTAVTMATVKVERLAEAPCRV